MKYSVVLSPEAIEEIAAAASWIESDSPLNSDRWLSGLRYAIESLSQYPKRCPIAPESERLNQEIRQLLYLNHRVLFALSGSTVKVLHVRHAARRVIGDQHGD